jgi:hypothetical protein
VRDVAKRVKGTKKMASWAFTFGHPENKPYVLTLVHSIVSGKKMITLDKSGANTQGSKGSKGSKGAELVHGSHQKTMGAWQHQFDLLGHQMQVNINHHEIKAAKGVGMDAHAALKQYDLFVDGVQFDRLSTRMSASQRQQASKLMPRSKPHAQAGLGSSSSSIASAANAQRGPGGAGGGGISAGSVEVNTMSFDKFVSDDGPSSSSTRTPDDFKLRKLVDMFPDHSRQQLVGALRRAGGDEHAAVERLLREDAGGGGQPTERERRHAGASTDRQLAHLQEMFPTLQRPQLLEALKQAGGDVDKAVTNIISESSEAFGNLDDDDDDVCFGGNSDGGGGGGGGGAFGFDDDPFGVAPQAAAAPPAAPFDPFAPAPALQAAPAHAPADPFAPAPAAPAAPASTMGDLAGLDLNSVSAVSASAAPGEGRVLSTGIPDPFADQLKQTDPFAAPAVATQSTVDLNSLVNLNDLDGTATADSTASYFQAPPKTLNDLARQYPGGGGGASMPAAPVMNAPPAGLQHQHHQQMQQPVGSMGGGLFASMGGSMGG